MQKTLHANNFNFLRLALAALVILSHSSELIDGNRDREILSRLFHTVSFGEVAVDGFFILSGYLITQSWLRSRSPASYLKKRALRIYPGFVVATLVSMVAVGPITASSPAMYFHRQHWGGMIVGALLLHAPYAVGAFPGLPYSSVNGSLWTVHFEFLCYLVLALLGLIGVLRYRPLSLTLYLSLVALHAIFVAHHPHADWYAWAGKTADPILGRVLGDPVAAVRFASFFFAGVCCYQFRDRIRFRPAYAMAAAVVLVLCLFKKPLAELGLATCGAYLLFYFGFARVGGLRNVGRRADVSYGLYLYGWPASNLLIWSYRSISPALLFLQSLALALLCGWLSWHLVEARFLRMKDAATGGGTGETHPVDVATAVRRSPV